MGPAFKRVWTDTLVYVILYSLFFIAYEVIFFLRLRLFDEKPSNEVHLRRTENDELNVSI